MKIRQFLARKARRIGGEDEIPNIWYTLAFPNAHVHLARAAVDAYGIELLNIGTRKMLFADKTLHRADDIGVRDDGSTFHRLKVAGLVFACPAFQYHTGHLFLAIDLLDLHARYEDILAKRGSVSLELLHHFANQNVRTALESEYALAHEIGENDSVGYRGIAQGGTIGVGDRLEQKPVHVLATGKECFKQLARGALVVIVEIHLAQVSVKGVNLPFFELEVFHQYSREILSIEGGPNIELGIDEAHILELYNRVGDFLGPIFPTRFHHSIGKSMQRNVENVLSRTFKPRRQATVLVVMFEQEYGVTAFGENIGAGEAAQTTADHHHVILVLYTFEPVFTHKAPTNRTDLGKYNWKVPRGALGSGSLLGKGNATFELPPNPHRALHAPRTSYQLSACGSSEARNPFASMAKTKIKFETNQGIIEFKLFPDIAPKACENFATHVENGYYDGIIFHRVIPDFMIQCGDPTGTGTGGESIWGKSFEDECAPDLRFDKTGILAMANAGPGTNGSQFFITTAKTPWLNMRHTIFGEVTEGYETVESIEAVATDGGDKPLEEQKIIKATVIE